MRNSLGIKIYLIALLFTTLTIFLQIVPIVTYDYLNTKLSINQSNFVYLSSLFFLSYSFMQYPSGILLDKYGVKYVLPISITLATLGLGMYWVGFNQLSFALSRIIGGFGCSVAYISGIYIATKYFPISRLPLLVGLVEAASTLGSVLAARPLKYSLLYLRWHITGAIIIGLSIILVIVSLLFTKKINQPISQDKFITWKQVLFDSIQVFANRNLIFIFIYSFSTWLVIMSFAGYWLKDYMLVVHKYSEMTSLKLVEIYWVSFWYPVY